MTTQIQTTTATNEVTVNLATGEAFISNRKLAKDLGVDESTTRRYFAALNVVITQGVSSENLLLCTQHFAQKGNSEAITLLVKISKAGARAYLYHEAGYVVSAAPIKQVALPEDYVSALRALADKEEQRILLMAENQEKHIETDSSTDYFTVRKIRSMNPDMKIDGKILGKVANIFNQPAKQVFDLYEQPVNTYTRTVWEEAYPDAELP